MAWQGKNSPRSWQPLALRSDWHHASSLGWENQEMHRSRPHFCSHCSPSSKLSPLLCASPVIIPLSFLRVSSAFWPPITDRAAHFHPHPAWLPTRLCILHIASRGRRSEGSGCLSKIPMLLVPCLCCKRHSEAHILTGASRSSSHMNSNDCNY